MADRKKRPDDRDKTPRELDDQQLDAASGGGMYAATSAARVSLVGVRTSGFTQVPGTTSAEASSTSASDQFDVSSTGGTVVGGSDGTTAAGPGSTPGGSG